MATPLTNEQRLALIHTILSNTLDPGAGEMSEGYCSGIIDAVLSVIEYGIYDEVYDGDEYDDDV